MAAAPTTDVAMVATTETRKRATLVRDAEEEAYLARKGVSRERFLRLNYRSDVACAAWDAVEHEAVDVGAHVPHVLLPVPHCFARVRDYALEMRIVARGTKGAQLYASATVLARAAKRVNRDWRGARGAWQSVDRELGFLEYLEEVERRSNRSSEKEYKHFATALFQLRLSWVKTMGASADEACEGGSEA